MEELLGFLQYLMLPAGAAVVASFILERISKFQDLESQIKQWVFFGLCGVLAIGAHLLVEYVPGHVFELIGPYFSIIASIFVAVFAGTLFHKVDKIEV
jgi:hypothetical protein